MFNIGDKILCPNQGVGVINEIKEQEFKGKLEKFYHINLINNSLKLMLPSKRIQLSNIRLVNTSSDLDSILNNIDELSTNLEDLNNTNCKDRIVINSNKIKCGKLEDYISVVKDLTYIKSTNHLNTNENSMLMKTKRIIAEEISLVKDISNDEAMDFLEQKLS